MRRPDAGLAAVVDTNVWIGAALPPTGAPAQVLRLVLLRGIVVFSEATFAELETRLWKRKFDRYIHRHKTSGQPSSAPRPWHTFC